jgi:hypothetical protein
MHGLIEKRGLKLLQNIRASIKIYHGLLHKTRQGQARCCMTIQKFFEFKIEKAGQLDLHEFLWLPVSKKGFALHEKSC